MIWNILEWGKQAKSEAICKWENILSSSVTNVFFLFFEWTFKGRVEMMHCRNLFTIYTEHVCNLKRKKLFTGLLCFLNIFWEESHRIQTHSVKKYHEQRFWLTADRLWIKTVKGVCLFLYSCRSEKSEIMKGTSCTCGRSISTQLQLRKWLAWGAKELFGEKPDWVHGSSVAVILF